MSTPRTVLYARGVNKAIYKNERLYQETNFSEHNVYLHGCWFRSIGIFGSLDDG
ncbi:hypothetical protein [Coleofasciculus sp. H7-2]|uniref:hypothetical protein n=1 Tax=Coleofasciculus sp. H7-2 TaxID=3351545 RepID=UPI00366D2D56